jgi:hypothetical protein
VQVYETSLQQCVQVIQGGIVTSVSHEEYIVQTFGGAIVSLSNGDGPSVSMPSDVGTEEQRAASRKDAAQAEARQLEEEVRRLVSESEVQAHTHDRQLSWAWHWQL